MNGADVAKAMCSDAQDRCIPVVLLTSVDQVDFARMVLDYGIAAHLTKPARSAALLGTVIAAIQKARAAGTGRRSRPAGSPRSRRPACTRSRAVQRPRPRCGKRAWEPGAPLDILVAEDNEVNQLVFAQILSGLGLSYRIAGNGRTAVEMHRSLKPKLILMDVSMPEMNGYEATRAIRAAEAAERRAYADHRRHRARAEGRQREMHRSRHGRLSAEARVARPARAPRSAPGSAKPKWRRRREGGLRKSAETRQPARPRACPLALINGGRRKSRL